VTPPRPVHAVVRFCAWPHDRDGRIIRLVKRYKVPTTEISAAMVIPQSSVSSLNKYGLNPPRPSGKRPNATTSDHNSSATLWGVLSELPPAKARGHVKNICLQYVSRKGDIA